ncbi:uncharacterized protein PHACADRAFT_207613 [Phanerochaete carnosa HHB-10118-sp]|uniref:Uncharacterized protein n=1 Tax=Phanerochaete carnosa (strain HHB-10118-sp) TaxID=650164 RepID=K5WBL7_PHACS|nr:uncharacterized protein PHACADRAFT_207613 [Phanerochaete carnosa HHB-10118-sp]EKM56359.1 hypothetical protein PHACADRAFT_207613 [Phanerochaete carnosa HHB-10118-sp]
MLNLRQLNHVEGESGSNSDAQHFSRFSVSFNVPSDFLGNIGEPLDHGQLERMKEDDIGDLCVAEEPQGECEQHFEPQAGPSTTCRDESTEVSVAGVQRSVERAGEEEDIESFAFPREMVAGPSTAAR